MTWQKYPDEIKIFPADWSEVAEGDTVTDVSVAVTGDLTCVAEHVILSSGLSKIRVTGGAARESGFVVATLTTSGGQTLTPQNALKIVARPTV